MRSLAILVLALCLYECRAMTFETVDNGADYEKDVRPYLHTGKSTKDFCLTTPYDANRKVSKSSFINAVQSITTI